MSFFRELKRRNVFRVGVAYVAVSWLVIQVIETLFPVFGFSDGVIRTVVILLAIGFIPAIVSAWAFELTPEGVKRETEVDHDSPVSRRMTRRLDRLLAVALALALGFFAFDKFVLDPARDAQKLASATEQAREEGRTEAKEEVRDASVAVLALQDLSPRGDQEYFGDGLAVDLIYQLSKVPQLRVTGKTSTFAFKDRDATIPEIGEALNVGYVLDGTVTRVGDRIRISVQLVDARQDQQIWSETYDKTLADIFAIRDDITARVFDRLTIEFERIEQESLRTDPVAYDLTLQARYLIDRMNSEDDYKQAASLVSRALAIDPNYVPALLASIFANYGLLNVGLMTGEEEARLASELIDRVLAIDPNNGAALGMLAWTDWENRMDLEAASRRFSDALLAAPGDLGLTQYAGMFARSIDRNAESIALLERCVAADPENWHCTFHLAQSCLSGNRLDRALKMFRKYGTIRGRGTPYYLTLTLLMQGEPERALREFQSIEDEMPDDPQALAARAMIMHDLGRYKESEAALQTIVGVLDESRRDHPYLVAQAYAWIGDSALAFEWLEKAYAKDERYGVQGFWFYRIMFLPVWRNLHDDSRWSELRERMDVTPARLEALEFMIPPWISLSAE